MRISDIMSDKVDVIGQSEPVARAIEMMKSQQIHHLVVIDGGEVVGVVSARDLKRRREGMPVGEVMSAPVATATPRATVRQAANLLRGRRVGCLPVLSDGRLVGIVTVSDLLDLLGSGVTRGAASAHHWDEKHRGHRLQRYVVGR